MPSPRSATPIRQGLVLGLTLFGLLSTVRAEEPVPGLTYHAAPKPLSPEAVTADWPRFLGPTDNAKTPETHLLERFPEGGPQIVWEYEKGTSYTSPSIVGDRLVLFSHFDGDEVVQCLEPETGRPLWEHRYPVDYRDRYGFNVGPRASPVIADGRVYTLGVTSVLTCLDLESGAQVWQHRLSEEYERSPYFFGHGCSPIVHGGKIIVPLGSQAGDSVVAFDAADGKLVWTTKHEWQAAYASPVIATLRGKERLLVFAGDDSNPPAGGLLCIEPDTGALLDAFPWRPDKYESVNGSTPVAVGDDRVFISSSYGKGSAMLRLNESLKWEELWRYEDFGLHWSTAMLRDGHLYGFQGRNEPDAWLAAIETATGKEAWRADPEFTVPVPAAGGGKGPRRSASRDYRMKYFRGSLLEADGRIWALGEFGTLGILELTPEGMKEIDR
ncbi:MAG TPA: PQQ-like beta-propeller repeat protein, partial [Bacteroidia bacterium]|nr:PQQ-like beta-propeller repeat protein [Bacteroidia bacterium]